MLEWSLMNVGMSLCLMPLQYTRTLGSAHVFTACAEFGIRPSLVAMALDLCTRIPPPAPAPCNPFYASPCTVDSRVSPRSGLASRGTQHVSEHAVSRRARLGGQKAECIAWNSESNRNFDFVQRSSLPIRVGSLTE